MEIHPKLKPILYGLGVFTVYIVLSLVIRLVAKRIPADAEFFGMFSTNDLLIGVVVAVVLTFTHERKKRIK